MAHCNFFMKRFFDIILSIFLLSLMSIPMLLIALLIKTTSKGHVLHWSERIGVNNRIFKMPKFRTMYVNAPIVATHLLEDPHRYMTPIGSFLRKFSLDELPQLWTVLRGDMSFVGPRPALHNQDDLITLRTNRNIHRLIPGITGWAQISGRDNIPIPLKVEFDEYYMKHRSFWLDLKILCLTLLKTAKAEGVWH